MGFFDKKKKKEVNNEDQSEERDAVLTLYACRKTVDHIPKLAEKLFLEVMESIEFTNDKENREFTIVFKDKTFIKFNILSDIEKTFTQAMGMANFFSQAPLKDEEVKDSVLQQIRLFNCIIGIQFKTNQDERRTNYIINTIFMLAEELTAFVLYPSMELFHSSGKLLISIDGKTDYEVFYPESCNDMLDKDIEETDRDKARKARSFKILKERGIPYIEHLKAAALEADSELQDKENIIKRVATIYATCVQAEVYTCGRYDNPQEKMKEELKLLDEQYGVINHFTAQERQYIQNAEKHSDEHNLFGWRYECCAVLLWALSLVDLHDPSDICSASELGGIIWDNSFDSLIDKSILRTKEEVLDLYDLVLRYHWACVDARIHGKQIEGLNSDVIYFWHYALNWLLKVDGITEWDEISPNT